MDTTCSKKEEWDKVTDTAFPAAAGSAFFEITFFTFFLKLLNFLRMYYYFI